MSELSDMVDALKGGGALHFVPTFTHGTGLQVKVKARKVGVLLLPNEGETVADILRTVADLLDGSLTADESRGGQP